MLRVCQQLASVQFFITSYYGFRFTSSYNSIKFCSAVSYCLRRCLTYPPDNHPQVIKPLFAAVRGSVWVRTPPRGSDRVRSTSQCQFSTKHSPGSVARCPTAAENGGYDQGGGVAPPPPLNTPLSGRISGFAAYRSTVLSTIRRETVKNKTATDGGERRAHRGVRRSLFAQDDDECL